MHVCLINDVFKKAFVWDKQMLLLLYMWGTATIHFKNSNIEIVRKTNQQDN